jgi:hypothetical protein
MLPEQQATESSKMIVQTPRIMIKFIREPMLHVLMAVALPLFVNAQEAPSSPCSAVQQVNIVNDKTKRRVMTEFLTESVRNNGFSTTYDKGIVHLNEYTNAQGELCWLLTPRIDDSYKDNPPESFSDFDGDIILVYKADSTGRVAKPTDKSKTAAINQCLEQIIGDRVFTRPATRNRWTSWLMPVSNKKATEGTRRNITGNGGSVIIIFDKQGGYRKSYPV